MQLPGFVTNLNIFHRVGLLEKSNRVSAIEGRAFSESDRFRLERQFPLPYYNEIRYLAKRNTSLRTIIHVLQDKVFERSPVFIPAFEKKCTLCSKEHDADEEWCSCGGILREPAPEELMHIKVFFKNCNLNDQHFCTVLKEFEDNLNIMDDGFLIVLKDYVFNNDNTELIFEKVREILSVTPEFMTFDLDDNLVQGNEHYTCVDHRQLINEPGICPECGKPLFPVYFTYGEGNSKAMPYLKGEVIHNSRYSPSKTYGYSPVATVFEEAMTELSGLVLLKDTYTQQRPPKGILAIVTRNLDSLQKFWKKEMDSVRTNPNHMPVMGIESETGRGKAEYISLMNSIADMDVLNVSDKMRESIAGLYRISPMYRGSTEGIGGLNAEDVQRAVTAEPVASAQKGYHDEVFPKLLKMFGITDWILEFPSPYPADDNADLEKRAKEVGIATQMHGMGFVVSMDENDEFVFTGESQKPEVGGYGDEMMLSAGLVKGKTYIDNPKEAPAGANVQQGPKGGYFYSDVGDSEVEQSEQKPVKEKPKKLDEKDITDSTEQMNSYLSKLESQPDGKDMVESVDLYTVTGYNTINDYLRKDNIGSNLSTDRIIDRISTFLKNAPKIEGNVYRGMRFSKLREGAKERFDGFLSDVQVGKSVMLKSFTSASVDKDTATLFSQRGTGHKIEFDITSKNGVYLNGSSRYSDEGEVLFDKESKFKIKNVDRTGYPDHVKIVMEEI